MISLMNIFSGDENRNTHFSGVFYLKQKILLNSNLAKLQPCQTLLEI